MATCRGRNDGMSHTMVGFTNGIESPWSCTVRRQVFLLDTDSGS